MIQRLPKQLQQSGMPQTEWVAAQAVWSAGDYFSDTHIWCEFKEDPLKTLLCTVHTRKDKSWPPSGLIVGNNVLGSSPRQTKGLRAHINKRPMGFDALLI